MTYQWGNCLSNFISYWPHPHVIGSRFLGSGWFWLCRNARGGRLNDKWWNLYMGDLGRRQCTLHYVNHRHWSTGNSNQKFVRVAKKICPRNLSLWRNMLHKQSIPWDHAQLIAVYFANCPHNRTVMLIDVIPLSFGCCARFFPIVQLWKIRTSCFVKY